MSLVPGLLAFALIFSLGIFVQGNRPYVNVNVTCHADGLVTIIVWNLTDLQEWGEDGQRRWNLSSKAECPPSDFNVTAQEVTYENFNASLCNSTAVSEIGDDIVYEFKIDAEVEGSAPTQTYHHEYNIKCRYNVDGTANASFVPLHELSDTDEDTEDLTLLLTLDPSSGTIPLGHNITAAVTVYHPFGEQLDLLLRRCYTTSTVDITGYELIKDSCAVDDFITSYNCLDYNSTTEEFVFEAFRYASQPVNQTVTITCEVYVCLASNDTSTCRAECGDCNNPVRRRRDVGDSFQDKIFQVTSDPFYVLVPDVKDLDNDHEEQEKEPETGSSTSLIIGLCVGGIAAVGIVCVVLIILTRRRTLSLPIRDTSTPGSYVNQGI